MSANTFFNFATWVNTEIQSAQLSRTNSILQTQLTGAASMLQEQAIQSRAALKNEKEIESLREIVFTTKKQLSEILKIVDDNPLEGLIFYLNSLQAFDYIDPSFFPSFNDKEYVDNVKDLASDLESNVYQKYDNELIKALPRYSAIDSIYADIHYRRFFQKAWELIHDDGHRGFFGLKRSFVAALKDYCTVEYSNEFWEVYIKFDAPDRVRDAARYRINRLEQNRSNIAARFRNLEQIDLMNNTERLFEMSSRELKEKEGIILTWLTEVNDSGRSIGLELPEPGVTFKERFKADYRSSRKT